MRTKNNRVTCEEYKGRGGCGADVFWAITHKGSKIQMDMAPGTTADHKWGRSQTVEGEFEVFIAGDDHDGDLFRCHWDACPKTERSGGGASRTGSTTRRSSGVSRGSSQSAPSADAIESSVIINGVTYHGWLKPVGVPADVVDDM